jgi:pimeloyl-ACP methyl ester carboxylesterase
VNLRVDNRQVYAYTGAREFEPVKEPIIFVHGGGLDHTVWLLQSRYFAHHGRGVLAVDLPAHGRSDGPPLESIPAMADWLVRLMDTAKVDKATLIGHSMGALAVHEAAARHPQRVQCLVTIGISVPMPVSDALLSAAKANRHDAFDMVNIWGHGTRAHVGGNQTPGMWMIGSGVRLLERSAPGVLYADLNACNEYREGLASSASITCPVHVILGKDDRMSPVRAARAMLDALSNPQVTIIENCGHMLMAEKPGEVLDILIDALDSRTD